MGESGKRRRVAAMALAAVVALSAAGFTLAWISDSEAVRNLFVRGEVAPQVEEQFNEPYTVKENVVVTNAGTMASYMRASVSVYWMDESGAQMWDAPSVPGDYTVAWADFGAGGAGAPCWIEGADGFYYWSEPLEKDASTAPLIERVEQVAPLVAEKRLVVDVATQALQAQGAAESTFDAAWGDSSGLTVGADGTLSKA